MTLVSGTAAAIENTVRAIPAKPHSRPDPRCSRRIRALRVVACILLTPSAFALQSQSNGELDFQQAEALLQQNRLVEARTLALHGLLADPSSVRGYNLLGMIEARQQDYGEAAAAFEKALDIAPASSKAHNNLGNVYVAEKKFDLAEKEFRTVVRLAPHDRDGNYNLGVVLLTKGSPAAAIPYLERVQPPDLPTQFNLIRAMLESRRTEEGLRLANQLSAQQKNSVRVHFSLGILLASEKQFKQAQFELEQADGLQPDTFEILYNLGQVLLREGLNPQAEVALNRALKLQPDSVETLYLLAQAESDQSRPLDALDHLMRAHKLAPENVDVIFQMAQVSMSQNYFEDAIPLLESGLKIAPQRADLLAALGESEFMAGKVDKAIDAFNELRKVDNSARSYAFLGLSYRNLGRFDEARTYFQEGLRLDPHSALCFYNLGFIDERQGNAAEAEAYFQKALESNPNFADALIELANLRIAARRYAEAETYLRRYVKVSADPANGYYKLAMAERSLHEMAAADRDLDVFKSLSKDTSNGPYPYQHLFDYLDQRAKLAEPARADLDLADLTDEIKRHPDQPEDLYMLAEAYLKAGRVEDARSTIAQLDQVSSGDFRTLAGVGVLLARYRLYDDAITHFQEALKASPDSDDVKFDLADAYFRKREYSQALEVAQTVSAGGQKDDAYLSLLGDIYAHMDDAERASEIFRDAIRRNPDNDQYYLSLALIELRQNDVAAAKAILLKGQSRVPGSGKLFWGLGLVSVLENHTAEAAQEFERTVELLPEWSGGYSTLGVFYFQCGEVAKSREVLDRYKESSATRDLDVSGIERVLDQASENPPPSDKPRTIENKAQFLQFALAVADRSL
jgi:tetratricopeptide (TPR) repeat protein